MGKDRIQSTSIRKKNVRKLERKKSLGKKNWYILRLERNIKSL